MEMQWNIPDFDQRRVPPIVGERLEPLIGRIFVSFAFAEQSLDFWLMEGMRLGVTTRPPWLTGDKIEAVRALFSSEPHFSNYARLGLSLLHDLEHFQRIRNDFAHGALSHFLEDPVPAVVLGRLRFEKKQGIYIQTDHVLTLAAIEQAAAMMPELVRSMHGLTVTYHRNNP